MTIKQRKLTFDPKFILTYNTYISSGTFIIIAGIFRKIPTTRLVVATSLNL